MRLLEPQTKHVLLGLGASVAVWSVVASLTEPQSLWRLAVLVGGLFAPAALASHEAGPAPRGRKRAVSGYTSFRQWLTDWTQCPLAIVSFTAYLLWCPLAWGEAVYLTGDAVVWTSLFDTIGSELARTHRVSTITSFFPTGPILQNVIPVSGGTVFVALGALTLIPGVTGSLVYMLVALAAMVGIGLTATIITRAVGVAPRFQSVAGFLAVGSAGTLNLVFGRGALHELIGVTGIMAVTAIIALAATGHPASRHTWVGGLVAGLLFTAHPISFVMGLIWLTGFLAAMALSRSIRTTWRIAMTHGAAIGLGIALNAWGLVPFTLLGPQTDGAGDLGRLGSNDYYFYDNAAQPPPISWLVNPLRSALIRPELQPSFAAVPAALLLLTLGCSVVLVRRRAASPLLIALPVLGLALPLLLRSNLAYAIPIMRINQYVNRPYIWASMLGALAIPIVLDRWWKAGRNLTLLTRLLATLLILECCGMAYHSLRTIAIVPVGFKLGPRLVDDQINDRSHASETFNKGLFQAPLLDADDCSPLRDPALIAAAKDRISIPKVQTCATEVPSTAFTVAGGYEFTLDASKFRSSDVLALPIATSSDVVSITGADVLGTLYVQRDDTLEAAIFREALFIVRPTGGNIVIAPRGLSATRIGAFLTFVALIGALATTLAPAKSSLGRALFGSRKPT